MSDPAKEIKRLVRALSLKTREVAAAEQERHAQQEREKVLCDLLVHQELYNRILKALDQHPGASSAAASPADRADRILQVLHDTVAAFNPRQPQQLQQQHESHLQQALLPDSCVADVLRRAQPQQVQQVLEMSQQDWVAYFADLFPQLLAQLEVCSRAEYQYDTAPNPPSPASLQQQQQQPLGASPDADRLLLQRTLEDSLTLVQLAWVFNIEPLTAASALSDRLIPSQGHWEHVVGRLQLAEWQELHISICMTEFQRVNERLRAEGACLVQSSEEPTLQLAVARQQTQQQSGGSSSTCSSSPPAPDAAQHATPSSGAARPGHAAGGEQGLWGEDLEVRLQQYMRKSLLLLISTMAFFANTLTTHQLALFDVAAYPALPSTWTLGRVVHQRVQARQEQLLRQVQAEACRQATASGRRTASQPAKGRTPSVSTGTSSGAQQLSWPQWLLQQHEKKRAAQLSLHQRVCWDRLGCKPPQDSDPAAAAAFCAAPASAAGQC